MSRSWFIFMVVLSTIVLAVVLVVDNVRRNLTGEFVTFGISNIKGILNPKADVDITFKIINNTFFAYRVKDFKVRIFNNQTGEYLSENLVKTDVRLPKGESEHKIDLKDVSIVGNLQDFLDGKTSYLAVVNFKVLGQTVLFEQLITL